MNRLINVLVLITVLFVFVQPEKQSALGRTSRGHSRVHTRAQRFTAITQAEADVTDWWKKECADCPNQVTNRNLWLSADGLSHIAYGCEQLHSASYDGVDWHLETDDSLAHVGTCFNPVMDQWGYPHLVYFDEEQSVLMYAYKDASGWQFQIVDTTGAVVVGASLALDVNGYPHISYSRSPEYFPDVDFDLIYAYRVDNDWHIVTVEDPDIISDPAAIFAQSGLTSLVLDANGSAHIGYVVDYNCDSGYPSDLKHAAQDDSGWTIELVNRFGSYPGGPGSFSMVLDGNGYPHLCYSNMLEMSYIVHSRVEYAYRSAEGWEVQIIDGLHPEKIGSISMVLDVNGYPHLVYPRGESLKYRYQDAGGWNSTTLAFASTENPSIVLGEDGYPHVSYNERSQEASPEIIHLKYRYQDADGWYVQTVDGGGGDVGYFASLASDSQGNPHISYYEQDNMDLRYAYRGKEGWHIQVVENEGDVGKWTSLALDDNENPHMSYIKNISCSYKDWIYVCEAHLIYAFHNSAGWQTQILDRINTYDGSVSMDTSLALDGEGYPHISYIGEAGELMVANLDASGWFTQTVVIGESFIEGPSLALDNDCYPHISYFYDGSLYYIFQDAAGWVEQMVDGEVNRLKIISLALDGDDSPHISYVGPGGLMYAYHDTYDWHIETVDVGIYPSLAVDMHGHPHISYMSTGVLKYAYRDASGWEVQTVESEGAVGSPSLALDGVGRPHISYKKGSNLMYTYNMGDYEATYLPLVMK